jgi:EAL domain-containing protein (putative c-di-GMP-specific phosphodiesterase class I)
VANVKALMLIVDEDPVSKTVLRAVAESLACDHVEAGSLEGLREILAVSRPAIAVLALDSCDVDCLAMLRELSGAPVPPATLLLGAVHSRVYAGARRAAESRGLKVIGFAQRPLEAGVVEQLLAPYLGSTPAIPLDELERAITERELLIEYLPKIDIRGRAKKLQGVEALVRWQHPRRGLLYPRHFLRSVENHDLMIRFTDFVMAEAVGQASQWRARGMALEMGINLSSKLIRDRDFPERLAMLLREHDLPAQQIVFDIAEQTSVEAMDLLLDVFTRLRILGVGLCLDNFGTGMSSLTELYRMPFSEIKVDQTLINDVNREQGAMRVVEAIANLAHTLELPVCATGIESRETFEFLKSAGFDMGQGRFFSGPVKPAVIEQLADTWLCSEATSTGHWRVMRSRA